VFGQALWWYARYVVVVLVLGLVLIVVTWLGHRVLDWVRRRHG
jgi:NADH:ubiquinone oxidoreductase subunit H